MVTRINRYLILQADGKVQLDTPNTSKTFWLQMGLIFCGFLLVMDPLIVYLDDSIDSFGDLFIGAFDDVFLVYLLHLVPIVSLPIWLITKPVKIFFDRDNRELLVKSSIQEIRYPWNAIRFRSSWIPTKIGGVQYLSIMAGPPFPEAILKKHARKLAMAGHQEFLIGIGGIDCRDGDEVHAYVQLFKALMETDEPVHTAFDRIFIKPG